MTIYCVPYHFFFLNPLLQRPTGADVDKPLCSQVYLACVWNSLFFHFVQAADCAVLGKSLGHLLPDNKVSAAFVFSHFRKVAGPAGVAKIVVTMSLCGFLGGQLIEEATASVRSG